MTQPREHMVDPILIALASACGVATEYWDQSGQRIEISEETIRAVLKALGHDTSSDEAIAKAEREVMERPWRRTLPAIAVVRQSHGGHIEVRVPHGTPVRAWVELESGGGLDLHPVDRWIDPRDIDGQLIGTATFAIPTGLPIGWHAIGVETVDGETYCELAVSPDALQVPQERVWGFAAQLYSVRSESSWSSGDLADLADLAAWSGHDLGADFVLINPLHAASPIPPMAPSPYLPVTRRFANPMYLRIEQIDEYADLDSKVRKEIRKSAKALRRLNHSADLLERDPMWEAKRTALRAIFDLGRSVGRDALFAAYCEREGRGLRDFAIWCAIVEAYGTGDGEWPEALRDADPDAVGEFALANIDEVDFHAWMQWQLDQQLAVAQRAAVDAGMSLGIVHDLAVGVHPEGSDAWSLRDVLAQGVSVGAPPDMYNQIGQDWSQPPWRPDALADAAYRPYRDMLRTILRHAGGIRVDHVLGLFRLYWIPNGMPASQGTFVRFDHEALLGILALEAYLAGAVVVGEDLGTVEDWIQEVLADRGILGTSILWFERDGNGQIRHPETWRTNVLASVSVHDLPPTAGYLNDEHVRIRAELGLLARSSDEEYETAARERQEWADLLVARGLLEAGAPADDMLVPLHRLLAQSPCRMLAVGLPDAVADRRAQNQPGTDQEYPNWRVPLCDSQGHAVTLDDVADYDLVYELVQAVTS